MAELTEETVKAWVESNEEVTAVMKLLVSALKKGGQSAGASLEDLGETGEDAANSFDALNDQVRGTEDEMASLQYAADRVSDAWGGVIDTSTALTKAFANSSKEILANGESFGVMRNFIDPLADGLGMAIKGLGEMTAGVVGLGASIPLVGGGFTGLADTIRGMSKIAAEVVTKLVKFGANLVIDGIEQLWGMFEGAASAGVLFTNGLSEMNEQRGNLSLTTKEYTDVVKNNRDSLTLLGGSVGEGAKRLAEVGKESKAFNQELRAMGITYAEQAENTAEFMASLNRSGQLRLMTDKEIAAASAEYQKNLAVMSSLTGKSVETMKKERDEALKNMAFQAELAKMDPAVRKEMEAALGSMPEGMKKAFQESVIFGKVMTDTGAIVSGANTYIEEYANSVRNGNSSNEDAFQSFRDQIKENAPELRKNLGDLAAAGMAELLGNGNAVTKSINDFAGALYNEITRAESGTKGSVDKLLSTGEKQEESVKQILSGLDSQRKMQDAMLQIIEKQALPAASAMFSLISETMNKGLTDFLAFLNDPDAEAEKLEGSIEKMTKTLTSTELFGLSLDDSIEKINEWGEALMATLGLNEEALDTKAFNDEAYRNATGQSVQAGVTDRNIAKIETGEQLSKLDVAMMYGDDFVENIQTNNRISAQAGAGRAEREIAKLQSQLDELNKIKGTDAEDTDSGFLGLGSTTESEIKDLLKGIQRLTELQAESNKIAEGTKKAFVDAQ